MNWAAQHELPPGQKTPHHAVQYGPGTDAEHCGNCRNYIRPLRGQARCRTVASPIESSMWCLRWDDKLKGE